jgi:hypothetical protein
MIRIKKHDVEQLSSEWFALRLGRITGSHFGELMQTGRGKVEWGQTAMTLLRNVACEILTGEVDEDFRSKHMEWGNQYEQEAKELFSFIRSEEVFDGCFYEIGPHAGTSPDGILSDNRVLEIKCPKSKTHFEYWLDSETLLNKYRWQVVGEMLGTGADMAYLCSYDPRMPSEKQMVIVEVERKEDEVTALYERIQAGIEIIEGWLK